MVETRRDRLVRELRQLKELLHDREAALPAHSVRPHQIQEIEDLEEKIAALEKDLEEIPKG